MIGARWRTRLFRWPLTLGALLIGAFAIAHLAGLREYTSMLSGTLPAGTASPEMAMLVGVLYLFLYFSAVFAAPVLLLTSAIFFGLDLIFAARVRKASNGAAVTNDDRSAQQHP